MKLASFALAAVAALALSAGTASAQYAPRSGYIQPVPSYGGYVQPAPSYGGYGNLGGPSYGGNFGGSRYAPGYGGGFVPAPRGHYDYVPGHFDRHRGHYDFKPGHYDYHAPFTPRPRH